jgi:hypothetical protein
MLWQDEASEEDFKDVISIMLFEQLKNIKERHNIKF